MKNAVIAQQVCMAMNRTSLRVVAWVAMGRAVKGLSATSHVPLQRSQRLANLTEPMGANGQFTLTACGHPSQRPPFQERRSRVSADREARMCTLLHSCTLA